MRHRAPLWVIDKLLDDAVYWIRQEFVGAADPNSVDVRSGRDRALGIYIAAMSLAGWPDGHWPDPLVWIDAMVRSLRGPWDGVQEERAI